MRKTRREFAVLLTIALAAACSSDEPRAATSSSESSDSIPQHPEIAAELIRMAEADQNARQAVFGGGGLQALDTAALARAAARLDSLDRAHTARLKEIIRTHGWPTPARVGREGARAAFLIVQHADRDPAFQEEENLTYLDSAVAAGDAPGEELALLTDRVRVAKGEPQLYGTQVKLTPDGPVFLPIEDSLHVDERRAALGMPPLAVYRALLEQTYRQAGKAGGDADKGSD